MDTVTIRVDVFLVGAIILLGVFIVIAALEYREYQKTQNIQNFVIKKIMGFEQLIGEQVVPKFNDITTTELQLAVHVDELENAIDSAGQRLDGLEIITDAHQALLLLKPLTKSVKRDGQD